MQNDRNKFKDLRREENESVSAWMTRIRRQAIHCDFGTSVEDVLLQKFISGLRGKALETVIERGSTINLKRAWEIATNFELDEKINKIRGTYCMITDGSTYPRYTQEQNEAYKKRQNEALEEQEMRKIPHDESNNMCVGCGKTGAVRTRQSYSNYVCATCGAAQYTELLPKMIRAPKIEPRRLFDDADSLDN